MNLKERSKTGNIRGLYKRNNEFKGQLPITNLVINKKNNLFADPNSGLKRWKKNASLCHWMYMVLTMLGRQKCIQLSH